MSRPPAMRNAVSLVLDDDEDDELHGLAGGPLGGVGGGLSGVQYQNVWSATGSVMVAMSSNATLSRGTMVSVQALRRPGVPLRHTDASPAKDTRRMSEAMRGPPK